MIRKACIAAVVVPGVIGGFFLLSAIGICLAIRERVLRAARG